MARVTRSKKIVDIAEDQTATALAIQTPLPEDGPEDLPLGEIPNGTQTMPSLEQGDLAAELKHLKAAYKSAIGGGKKAKRGKNNKKKGRQDSTEQDEAVPDQSLIALATDYVVQNDANATEFPPRTVSSEADTTNAMKIIPRTTRASHQQLAKQQTAEVAAIKVTQEMLGLDQAPTAQPELSVQETIKENDGSEIECYAQSPAKAAKTLEEIEKAYGVDKSAPATPDAIDDSFVEQITGRSPAKPVSRIEDSVEALDQLEEALEALGQAAMAQRIDSPNKPRHKVIPKKPLDGQPTKEKPKTGLTREQKMGKQQPSKPGYASMRVKSTAPKISAVKKTTSMTFKPDITTTSPNSSEKQTQVPEQKALSKRPISLLHPKEPVKSTKPVTRPTNFELPGEAVARKLKEQREARLALRESSEESSQNSQSIAPRVKSTKPPTKPTFELPGEAVSRRKKEALEARLKAQEEEERKRREFKAKPLRKSVLPNVTPRDTVASRARQSKVGIEGMQGSDLSGAKRASVVGAHRPSLTQAKLANISAPRSPGPAGPLERKPSTKYLGSSMSGLVMQRTVSGSDLQAQRQRAKEIYNRDNKLAEDLEREKREREAAARRSREEAAERGRQASREWAEKQKAKKMTGGDMGMSVGYGPGGQMGLKA